MYINNLKFTTMRKLRLLAVLAAIVAVGCQQENFDEVVLPDNDTIAVEQSGFRSYDEALEIAENSIRLIEGKDVTRSTMKRRIIKNNVQTIRSNATRSGNTSDDPVAYVVNFEDNQGFAVIAANEQINPLIAVTESGNYTYGEPTGVEAFDDYMDNAISTLAIVHPPITLPDDPITPTPGVVTDTVDIYGRVDPLLTTKWGQDGIYGAKYPTGEVRCAAVALGQIIAYHQSPTIMQQTHSNNLYMWIPWNDILRHDNANDNDNTDSSCDCGCNYNILGTILYELGYRLHAKFVDTFPNEPVSGSGRDMDVLNVLHDFGYDESTLMSNVTWDISSTMTTVFDNLDAHQPVYVGGSNDDNGHAWVVDGYHNESYGVRYYRYNTLYDPINPSPNQPRLILVGTTVTTTRMLHCNWGYNGMCNGWFTYGNFDLDDGELYDDIFGNYLLNYYTKNFGIIHGIK